MTARRDVAVFGSSKTAPTSQAWADAESVGRRLAAASLGVITGGYGGTMEAVSKGASEAGGHVIGVTVPSLFPGRVGANPYVGELIEADDLMSRIGVLTTRAAGTIALPGSIGTATELLVAWNVNHVVRLKGGQKLPTVAVGEEWAAVVHLLVSEVGAVKTDIHLANTSDEAVRWLIEEIQQV